MTLYSGIAGGADIILIPEIPYDIIEKLPNSLTGDVIYPIAALKGDNTTADELEAAKEFIAYLQTDEAMSVFEKYHFTVNE